MTLTLSSIAEHPETATYSCMLGDTEKIIVRPLMPDDTDKLATFLQNLSPETRQLSVFDGYDLAAAQALCEAINKYDKLRFVVELATDAKNTGPIIGLFEFSLGLPHADVERFSKQGITLNEATDCRFGPTLSDEYQGKGLGSALFPYVVKFARQLARKRIILWGGVLKDNVRAIHFYEKHYNQC